MPNFVDMPPVHTQKLEPFMLPPTGTNKISDFHIPAYVNLKVPKEKKPGTSKKV